MPVLVYLYSTPTQSTQQSPPSLEKASMRSFLSLSFVLSLYFALMWKESSAFLCVSPPAHLPCVSHIQIERARLCLCLAVQHKFKLMNIVCRVCVCVCCVEQLEQLSA